MFKPMYGYVCANSSKFKNLLSFKIVVIIGQKKLSEENIILYKIVKNKLIVPRFFLKNDFIRPVKSCDWKFGFDLWPYQENIKNSVLDELGQKGGCNLILKTGMGKTYIAAKVIEALGVPTLIITNNKEIMRQWEDILPATLFYGEIKERSYLTIGVIHTLLKQPREWFSAFKFFVFDEITEYLSAERRKIFWFPPEYILGLTATPEDKGEKTKILKYFAGRFLTFNVENPIKWNIKIKLIKYFGPPEFTRKLISKIGYVSATEMNKQFEKDPRRFEILCDLIEKYADHNLFIFCNTCNYARKLYEKCNVPDKYLLMGKEKTAEMSELNEKAKLIFTTYSYSTKGVSINRMNGIVMAQPRRNNITQLVGRILRGQTADKPKIIIDLVDSRTTISSQLKDRKKVYKTIFPEINFEIEKYYSLK